MIASLRDVASYFPVAYLDVRRMCIDMRPTVLAILGIAVLTWVGIAASTWIVRTYLGQTVSAALISVAGFYYMAPRMVALSRYLALDGRSPAQDFGVAGHRFFAWTALFALLSRVPEILYILIADPGPGSVPQAQSLGVLAVFATTIALLVFYMRAVVLLPTLAMGRSIMLSDALAATRKRFWFIFIAMLLPIAPVWFAAGFVARLVMAMPEPINHVLFFLVRPTFITVFVLLSLSVSTRLCRRFAVPAVAATT